MKSIGHQLQKLIPYTTLYLLTGGVIFLVLNTEPNPQDEFSYLRLFVFLLFAPIILKYLLHLMIAPWYPLVQRFRIKNSTSIELPSVSVLIPAWNEEVGVQQTLSSVVATKYPKLEIIVINDGSTDKTGSVVKRFVKAHEKTNSQNCTIKYREVQNGGKGRALNIALSEARNDIVVTVDADCSMRPDAIKNLVKNYTDHRVASVAGNVAIGNRSRSLGPIQQIEYLYGFYFKRADAILNAVYIVGGAAASYRRSVLLECGGFDESIITEDIELSTRLQFLGYKVSYAADSIVYTEGPSDFSGLCKQRLRWKFGRLETFWKYRSLFFSFKKQHNQYLTCLILPIALFAEVLLFFEWLLLGIFFYYTITTNDFMPLLGVIILLTAVVIIQIYSDPQRKYHSNLIWFAPGAWAIFYFIDFVEYQALIGSIKRFVLKQSLSWQRWERVGVFKGNG